MRAEPGPMIKVLLPSFGIEGFCSTLQKLSICFGELGAGATLAPVFVRIDPQQLVERGASPISLPELAREVEELARRHPKVSFTTKLEGAGSVHTWQVSITTTKIPILTARRVSVLPGARNYEGEVAWAKESLKKATIHLAVTTSPDYSEFAERALPQCFYVFQKLVKVPQLKRMAEVELTTGAPNPIWPIPTEVANAVASRFGVEPLLIPESDLEKERIVEQIDACLLNDVSNAAMDEFLSNVGVHSKIWFR